MQYNIILRIIYLKVYVCVYGNVYRLEFYTYTCVGRKYYVVLVGIWPICICGMIALFTMAHVALGRLIDGGAVLAHVVFFVSSVFCIYNMFLAGWLAAWLAMAWALVSCDDGFSSLYLPHQTSLYSTGVKFVSCTLSHKFIVCFSFLFIFVVFWCAVYCVYQIKVLWLSAQLKIKKRNTVK